MFQYATARSLADRYNELLKLDISGFKDYTLRHYELGDFNIRAEIADKKDLDFFMISTKRQSLWQRIQKRVPFFTSKMVFREASFTYDDRFCSLRAPVYLDGYWQTERYFAFNSEAIRQDFMPHIQLDERNREILSQIEIQNAVSLHVRRGDYVSDPRTNDFHGVCSLEYYHAAVRYIAKRVKQPHIFVFSDDYSWARNNLDLQYPSTFLNANSNDRGIFDMILMRHCQHHIIANSSFSWWGAWLNPSPDKIVITPKSWFNKAQRDTRDLIPQTWITL